MTNANFTVPCISPILRINKVDFIVYIWFHLIVLGIFQAIDRTSRHVIKVEAENVDKVLNCHNAAKFTVWIFADKVISYLSSLRYLAGDKPMCLVNNREK